MMYRGHVQGGKVIFDEQVTLPEGTIVRIEPIRGASTRTLAERFRDVIGSVSDLPEDMAKNHDHYIHGTPKE